MEVTKIKTGKKVKYVKSNGAGGVGKVVEVYTGGRGDYVRVYDTALLRNFSVRPSQVQAA